MVEDFPHIPVLRIHLCNGGDTGSIPGQGTKILYAMEQISLHGTAKGAHVLQLLMPALW